MRHLYKANKWIVEESTMVLLGEDDPVALEELDNGGKVIAMRPLVELVRQGDTNASLTRGKENDEEKLAGERRKRIEEIP